MTASASVLKQDPINKRSFETFSCLDLIAYWLI